MCLSSLLLIHSLLQIPFHYPPVVVFNFCLSISFPLSFIIHSWPCIIKTIFLIFSFHYTTISCVQSSLSSYGFPAQEHLMNIFASGVKFGYILQHSSVY